MNFHPDFTILRMPAREEVYLEHLGVNLFITYETGKQVLNTRVVDGLLKKLFVEE